MQRTQFLFEREVVEQARRITSKANLWADLGSRRRLADALRQAERLGLQPRRVHVPCAWRETTELFRIAVWLTTVDPPRRAPRYSTRGPVARTGWRA